MIGTALAAMARPLDAPLYRRPWPPDLYSRIQADTFHIGGWYDIFLAGTLDQYAAMRDVAERTGRRAPHLLIGPWTHSSYLGNTGQLDFGPAASGAVLDGRGGLNAEHLRWYDATLKGDEQALADTAPVRLFVMGENRWRGFDHIPVPGAYASRTGTCSPAAGSTAPPRPTVRPTPTSTTRPTRCPPSAARRCSGRRCRPAPFDQREIEARPDVLSYTSAPLAAALHGARRRVGHPVRGLVRARHRLRRPARRRAPRRPRRQHRRRHLRAGTREPTPSPASSAAPPRRCEPDEPYRFCIDLWATGVRSCPVTASGSTSPPARTPAGSATPTPSATRSTPRSSGHRPATIFHDTRRPSRIHLSVVVNRSHRIHPM